MGYTIVAGIGIAVAAAGSAYSAVAASDNADEQRKVAADNALAEQDAAREQAALVKQKAERFKGEQRAALAASGVSLNSDSANVILAETDRLAEQDALAVIKSGGRSALATLRAGQLKADQLDAQAVGSWMNTASKVIGGASSMMKSNQPGTTADTINLKTDAIQTTGNKSGVSLLGGGNYFT